jgi:hypothetical protein
MKLIEEALMKGIGSRTDLLDARETLDRFQKNADEVAARLEKLRDKLAKLKAEKAKAEEKPAKPEQPVAAEDKAKKIADLEREIKRLEREKELLEGLVSGYMLFLTPEQQRKIKADEIQKCSEGLKQARLYAEEVAKRLKAAQDNLAKSKSEKKPGRSDSLLEEVVKLQETYKQFADRQVSFWEESLKSLKESKDPRFSRADPKEAQKNLAALQQAKRDAEEVGKKLKTAKDTLATLKLEAAKQSRGYLDLTISGKTDEYVLELKETDASDKVVGTVTLRDTSADAGMLTRLLLRTKADPNSPLQVRIVAQPQTALGYGPRAALKACKAAGYKTVKFTGYVYTGGFARELGPDWKGRAAGYTRYDAADRKPDELLKEIEEGLKKW